ncbi:MAG TPA: type II secretion system protein GspC [Steroidobacteraceae bacterium]|nr:type II secretion system protein GspC [Steroidobacteraceae bacterium]
MQLVDRIVAPLRRPSGGAPELASAAPTIATVLLAIVIAAQLASLVWRALGSGDAELDAGAVDDTPQAPAVDLPAIVNAHLFGVAADTGDPSTAPATSANLSLTGTLAGREPEQGWAIIGASGQSARVYATGTALPGGTKLVAVYPDRVILDRNGARESLMLPRLSGGAGSAMAPRVAARGQASSPDGSLADSVRQLLVQNPQAGGDLLRPQPVFAGGSLRGYRVYPGRNRAQFAGLGLQPGDLVMAVNGAALDDPNRGLEILRGVGQGSAVTLTVERGGQQQQITIDPVTAVQELQQAPVEEEPVEEEEPEEVEVVEEDEPATE